MRKLLLRGKTSSMEGYTLIELLLYVVIFGSFIGAVFAFYGLVQVSQAKGQVIAEVNQQGASAMQEIVSTLHAADAINTPSIGTSAASASLAMASAPVNPTVFDLSGTSLRVTKGAAGGVLMTSPSVQVSGLAFRNLSYAGTPGTLQVTFTLTSGSSSGRSDYFYQKTFTTTVALRQ